LGTQQSVIEKAAIKIRNAAIKIENAATKNRDM